MMIVRTYYGTILLEYLYFFLFFLTPSCRLWGGCGCGDGADGARGNNNNNPIRNDRFVVLFCFCLRVQYVFFHLINKCKVVMLRFIRAQP